MRKKKVYQVFVALAGLFLFVAQSAWAVNNISPQAAHDNAAAGNGIIIDVRSVEEHNGCDSIWNTPTGTGSEVVCPNPEVANDGHPEWIDDATGVIMDPPNVPFWISDPTFGQNPENPVEFAASFELLRNAGVISYSSPLYLICRSGFRSYWSGIFLEGQGYTNVYTVDSDGLANNAGGMLEWYAAGLPQISDWMPPQIYSVSPADGEVLTSDTVTFIVGIMEPTWGASEPYANLLKSYVDRVSLYIDGVQTTDIILPAGTPGTGLWTEFTFTETLTPGSHIWNVEAVDEYGALVFNPYAFDLGPGDRTLTITACTDADSDGYSLEGGDCGLVDCDDTNALVFPGADDSICDGVDNNCDNTPDDGYVSTSTSCGLGECSSIGSTTCVGGILGDTCTPGAPTGDDSDCNGLDEDCDGVADNNYVPVDSSCGLGECASTGLVECVDGSTSDTCVAGAPTGDDADCNGLDEDCDGVADNNYVPVDSSCGVGECASTGLVECIDGSTTATCVPGSPTGNDDDCNGLDEDCDGVADNNYVPVDSSCGVGECASTGLVECIDGSTTATCVPGSPTGNDDDCNGLDEDCDGIADNNYVATDSSCGVGECASTGRVECVDGSTSDTCVVGAPTGNDADCNGLDEDCDGVADNNYVVIDSSCGVGECVSTGRVECVDGSTSDTCVVGAPTGNDADCNGLDEDCDGVADNNYVAIDSSCGVGECASTGLVECVDGSTSDTCTPGTPSSEVCNDGLDNDCDGLTDTADSECGAVVYFCDNDNDGYIASSVSGSCLGTGCEPTGCVLIEGNDCDDSASVVYPGADDSQCDGIDNNCNGTPDDAYIAVSTTCGVGACESTGLRECLNGSEVDSCVEGSPSTEGPFGDATCGDSVDNDCDGATDVADSGCVEVCIPTGDDSDCNGIDDDCDGIADNNYVTTGTTCGVGTCASTGLVECVNGSEVDSCVEGVATGDDADCNGLDDNCDGVADNNYVPVSTTCGVGACESTGESSCVNGAELDTCTPGTPGVEGPVGDPTCSDAVDNDCDGATDTADPDCGLTCTDIDNDGYAVEGGDCGPIDCNDNNSAINPGEAEVCDGVDNDCNGSTDEGFDVDGDGYTVCGGDCDDNNQAVNVGATEGPFGDPTCSDALDNDCDGAIDVNDRNCQEDDGYTRPKRRRRRRRMR